MKHINNNNIMQLTKTIINKKDLNVNIKII